jgi:hypothetical protein
VRRARRLSKEPENETSASELHGYLSTGGV